LSKIITGKADDRGPFALYASITEEYEEPKKAHIRFEARGIMSHMTIDSGVNGDDNNDIMVDAWLEPIRNPVTGKVHRAIIELPEGFESSRMNQTSIKTLVANDSNLKFQYEGTYGSISENTWKGP
jgi:hypothetical protein